MNQRSLQVGIIEKETHEKLTLRLMHSTATNKLNNFLVQFSELCKIREEPCHLEFHAKQCLPRTCLIKTKLSVCRLTAPVSTDPGHKGNAEDEMGHWNAPFVSDALSWFLHHATRYSTSDVNSAWGDCSQVTF